MIPMPFEARQMQDRLRRVVPAAGQRLVHVEGVYLDANVNDLANALRYLASSFEDNVKALAEFSKAVSDEQEADWKTWIGQKVRKDRKPFKSGRKVNTVKGIIEHPILGVSAFTFFEDDSYVECCRCYPKRECEQT